MKPDIEGLDEANKAIEQMKAKAARLIKNEVKNALVEIETGAKARAPVGETGDLREAIAHTYRETATGATGLAGVFSGSGGRERIINSALAAEFGTHKQEATPFLFPAAEQVRPRFYAKVLEIAGNLGGK